MNWNIIYLVQFDIGQSFMTYEKLHEAGILCMKRLIGKVQLVDIEINKKTNLAEI